MADELLLLADGSGNLLLTDATDLLLVSSTEPSVPSLYRLEGRRLYLIEDLP